jgi:hypothetical protein
MQDDFLIGLTLQTGVPLRIMEMEHRGGPSDLDLNFAREYSSVLGSKGDVLLFGSKKKGECAELMNGLIRAVAVLAFCPGGVRLFGSHFEGHVAGRDMKKKWEELNADEKIERLRKELKQVREDLVQHDHAAGKVVVPLSSVLSSSDPLA